MAKTRSINIYVLFIFTNNKDKPPYGIVCYSKSNAKTIINDYKAGLGSSYRGYKIMSLNVDEVRLKMDITCDTCNHHNKGYCKMWESITSHDYMCNLWKLKGE